MLGLFNNKAPLDETSILWMFDVFAWALKNFDARVFNNETILVTPSNAHFPGNVTNASEMARLIFDYTRQYAGMTNWPLELVHEDAITSFETPRLTAEGVIRGAKSGTNAISVAAEQPMRVLIVPYGPASLRDPQILAASYAHSMAHYLGQIAQDEPPGGMENWPHVTELLAVFMGFGVIMANTAFTTKIRSCASCSGPAVERTNFLSQYDITYALAIFSALKGITIQEVNTHLKSTLRSFYKKSAKDVLGRGEQLQFCRRYLDEK